MDVIALAQAGFSEAVAPLGTAVTEDQIKEMWRLTAEPMMCFDGDKAGQRAATRVVERSLSLLKPGYSLRFVYLPEGEDPDSFVAGQGAEAFEKLLNEGSSLAEVLWIELVSKTKFETPEQRAGLEQKISQTLAEIKDPKVRGYYESDFKKRLKKLFGSEFVPEINLHQRPQSEWEKENQKAVWKKSAPNKIRFSNDEVEKNIGNLNKTKIGKTKGISLKDRERLVILTVLEHPWLLEGHEEQFATFEFESLELDKVRNEIIRIASRETDLENETLRHHLLENGLGQVVNTIFKQGVLTTQKFIGKNSSAADTEETWLHSIELFQIEKIEKEIAILGSKDLNEEEFARLQALLNEQSISNKKISDTLGKDP